MLTNVNQHIIGVHLLPTEYIRSRYVADIDVSLVRGCEQVVCYSGFDKTNGHECVDAVYFYTASGQLIPVCTSNTINISI